MAAVNQDSISMRVALFGIRKTFPKVKQLQTEVLASWLDTNEIENLVLLDVREIDEYKVSHLPGAVSVKPDERMDQVVRKIADESRATKGSVKIVAYCSVGYRSCIMAQKIYHELKRLAEIEELGFSAEVYNLEGSIFKWANEGRMMVDCEDCPTKYCHPYNVVWGKLLDYNLRKHEPETKCSL